MLKRLALTAVFVLHAAGLGRGEIVSMTSPSNKWKQHETESHGPTAQEHSTGQLLLQTQMRSVGIVAALEAGCSYSRAMKEIESPRVKEA